MDNRVYLKPAKAEVKVRKPDTSHLAADGEWVPLTTYWKRRLATKEVVKARPPKQSTQNKE